jgi:hypothetical protein
MRVMMNVIPGFYSAFCSLHKRYLNYRLPAAKLGFETSDGDVSGLGSGG